MLQAFFSSPPPLSLVLGLALTLAVFIGKSSQSSRAKPKTRKVHRLKSALPLLGDTLQLQRHVFQLHDWMTELCALHKGEPFMLQSLGRPPMTVLCTPEAYEDVLKTHFDCFPKGPFMCSNMRDFIGHGIFAVDGAQWAHQRKIASNLFTMRAMRDRMTGTIQEHAQTLHLLLRRAASAGQPIDLFKLFNRFTLEAFAEIGFGIHLDILADLDKDHSFERAFDEIQRAIRLRFIRPSWFWRIQKLLGVGEEGALARNLALVNSTILEIVAQALEKRGARDNQPATLVSLFLDNTAQNKKVDAAFLRDMVMSFLIAGRDTTAQTLSWLVHNLHQHPEIVRRAREEIAAKIPDLAQGRIDSPSMQQVETLVYLEAVLKETLRLHPPVPLTTKHVARDVVLSDGTFVAANTTVSLPSYAMARMPHVWGPDAAEFNPDRWIDPATGKLIPVSTFKFPSFLAGPRMCLGMNLAMLELKLVAAGLLSQFEMQVLPDQEITYGFSLTLPMKNGLMVSVLPKPVLA